ncbi:MAG: hypothetical protein H0W72_00655 [Planctomycetes bacterium]|nr:hypothetical protein [Planctomycetota bacterium]
MILDRIARRSLTVSLVVHALLVAIALVRIPWWTAAPADRAQPSPEAPMTVDGGELVLAPTLTPTPQPALPALSPDQRSLPALPPLPVVAAGPMRPLGMEHSHGEGERGRSEVVVPSTGRSETGIAAELRGRTSVTRLSHDDDMRRTAANLLQGRIEAQWQRSWRRFRQAVTNRTIFVEIRYDAAGRICSGRVAPGTTGSPELDLAISHWLTHGGLILPPFSGDTCIFKVSLW